MPWNEASTMSLRQEFVPLASQEGANVRQLCRRFEIGAKTGLQVAGALSRRRRPRTGGSFAPAYACAGPHARSPGATNPEAAGGTPGLGRP